MYSELNNKIDSLIALFENGAERYQQSAMFNQVINSLAIGTDPFYIIDQILKANDGVQKAFEDYAKGDTRSIVIQKSDNE